MSRGGYVRAETVVHGRRGERGAAPDGVSRDRVQKSSTRAFQASGCSKYGEWPAPVDLLDPGAGTRPAASAIVAGGKISSSRADDEQRRDRDAPRALVVVEGDIAEAAQHRELVGIRLALQPADLQVEVRAIGIVAAEPVGERGMVERAFALRLHGGLPPFGDHDAADRVGEHEAADAVGVLDREPERGPSAQRLADDVRRSTPRWSRIASRSAVAVRGFARPLRFVDSPKPRWSHVTTQ